MNANLKKVLIIEDEKAMAQALQIKLGNCGFDATAVYNGADALRAVNKSKFDLVLLDLVMPKLDGFAVLADFKKNNIATPVIVCTNLSQEEDIKRARELGAVDYVIKSNISIADIVERIKSLLGGV